jgi:SAM-dependent methyltransferase
MGFAAAGAGILAIAALVAGDVGWAAAWVAVAIGAGAATRRRSLAHPEPMPYALRWFLYLPRWPLTATRLRAILEPRSGERLLELGPGVGIYSLPIAGALQPGGRLDALDVQCQMLATLERRARKAGVTNVVATEGDAQRLPYADCAFDAAYLIGVLGEIPDADAALRELRRVLKPGGRLVVGEVLVVDPDAIRLPRLEEKMRRSRFVFERRLGPRFAYYARFRVAD